MYRRSDAGRHCRSSYPHAITQLQYTARTRNLPRVSIQGHYPAKHVILLPVSTSPPSQACQKCRGIKTHPPEITISEKPPLTDSHTAKYFSAIPTQCFFHILIPSKAPSQAAQSHLSHNREADRSQGHIIMLIVRWRNKHIGIYPFRIRTMKKAPRVRLRNRPHGNHLLGRLIPLLII
jgi:hypothetical protein